ncbi:hypothetical protein ScPMuIL_017455 [Solemya velum]
MNRFDSEKEVAEMGNPTNALLGMFVLWWGWLGFNCGSTFGISGGKWKLSSKAAATTILASCGGGVTGITISFLLHRRKCHVSYIINGVLGGLVSITAICPLSRTWQAILIGSVGGGIANGGAKLLVRMKLDDPVCATSVHGFCSVWGLVACGLFAQKDRVEYTFNDYDGLFEGGGFYLLGVQLLAVAAIIAWSALTAFLFLKLIDVTFGLRLSPEDELKGSDLTEHDVGTLETAITEFLTGDRTAQERSRSRLQSLVRQRRVSLFGGRRESTLTVPETIQLKRLTSQAHQEGDPTFNLSTISILQPIQQRREITQNFLPLV